MTLAAVLTGYTLIRLNTGESVINLNTPILKLLIGKNGGLFQKLMSLLFPALGIPRKTQTDLLLLKISISKRSPNASEYAGIEVRSILRNVKGKTRPPIVQLPADPGTIQVGKNLGLSACPR